MLSATSKIRKGDLVEVISGKEKGKAGKVISMVAGNSSVLVESVNVAKRSVKPSAKFPQGGIIEKEMPIFVSKVQIKCGSCNKATRVGFVIKNSAKVRTCKRCGGEIKSQ